MSNSAKIHRLTLYLKIIIDLDNEANSCGLFNEVLKKAAADPRLAGDSLKDGTVLVYDVPGPISDVAIMHYDLKSEYLDRNGAEVGISGGFEEVSCNP